MWTPQPMVNWYNLSTHPVPPLENEYQLVTDRVSLSPREAVTAPVSRMVVTNQPMPSVNGAYRFVNPHPTRGLFPGSMAITRVAVQEAQPDTANAGQRAELRPVIRKSPRNEFLHWNTAFDDQMAISEVFPVDRLDLGGGEADPRQILAAFRALNANIGMIYAVNELSPIDTEMFGTLYDIAASRPIAHIHAHARSPLPAEEDSDEPVNLWETDSKALAQAKFQRLVYDCIRDLVQHDVPAEVEAPTGWQSVLPERPVTWPPRPNGY